MSDGVIITTEAEVTQKALLLDAISISKQEASGRRSSSGVQTAAIKHFIFQKYCINFVLFEAQTCCFLFSLVFFQLDG